VRYAVAAIGAVTLIVALAGIGALSHRVIYGRWRGSEPAQRRRGVYAVVAVTAVWLSVLAGVALVRPTGLGVVLVAGLPLLLGVLLGAVGNYRDPL
jgi:hypothetical protein